MHTAKPMIVATSIWHLKRIIDDLLDAEGFGADLNHIDVRLVCDMEGLFSSSLFNGSIDRWNVENVTSMASMFTGSQFNGDISRWNVGNVRSMSNMFSHGQFNGAIDQWDVLNVESMCAMFYRSPFRGDVSAWNVANVRNFDGMFADNNFSHETSRWSIAPNASIRFFVDRHVLSRFEKPTMYHWLLALEDRTALQSNSIWIKHFLDVAPIARGMTSSVMEAAILIQNMWLELEHVVRPECSLTDVDLNEF